jgi:hypothetical protein
MGAAHTDLRDLRVFNAEGETLPYAITAGTARYIQSRHEVKGKLFPLYADNETSKEITPDAGLRIRRDADGRVEIEFLPSSQPPPPTPKRVLRGWLVDTGADFPLERLAIGWQSSVEGFYHFTVEASDDLEHWRRWAQGQIVHLSFDGETISQGELRLPGGKARYLRLIWNEPWVADTVREVRLFGSAANVKQAPPIVWSPLLPGEAVADHEGEYVWRLPVALPLVRVRIPLTEDNTLAPVILSGRDVQSPEPKSATENNLAEESGRHRLRDTLRGHLPERRRPTHTAPGETPWRVLARGVLYRLPGIALHDDELDLPSATVNQLRLQVDIAHGGNVFAHAAPKLALAVHAQQLTFLARGGRPYRLAWGKQGAEAAALPLPTLVPGAFGPEQIGRAHVVGETSAPAAVVANAAPAAPEDKTKREKILLWAVLIVGVILLVAMAANLLKTVDKKPRQ